jgi:hypothetical protein
LLSHQELASGIDGEDAVECFGGDFGDVPECLDAGVGDYDVDVLEVGVGFIEELHDVGRFGDVGCYYDGFSAQAFDFFDNLFVVVGIVSLTKGFPLRGLFRHSTGA